MQQIVSSSAAENANKVIGSMSGEAILSDHVSYSNHHPSLSSLPPLLSFSSLSLGPCFTHSPPLSPLPLQDDSNSLSSGSELVGGEEEEEGELGRHLDFSDGEEHSLSRADSTDDF